MTFQSHMSEDQNHLFSVIKEKVEWITLKYNQTSFTKLRVLKQRFNMNSSCDAKLTECVSALSEESKHSHLICRQETDRLFDQLFTWNQVWFCSSGFRPELHLHEHHEGQAEDQEEDLQESGVCVCVCLSVCLSVDYDVTQGVVNDVSCDVTQGVVVSDEELRRTFLQPEEAGPHQQGEEPVDGFRHPDLLGTSAPL